MSPELFMCHELFIKSDNSIKIQVRFLVFRLFPFYFLIKSLFIAYIIGKNGGQVRRN